MKRFFLALIFAFGLGVSPAWAHPHAWIDVGTHVLLDAHGTVVGLREHWVFDPFYTEFALHDFAGATQGKSQSAILMELATDNLNNLKPYHYFTEITSDGGAPLPLKAYTDAQSRLEKKQIVMDFTVWLAAPVDPRAHKVQYRIYDPSYYIAIKHLKKDAIQFDGPQAAACHGDLFIPKPDLMHMNLASSLDQKAVAPPDLGTFFAEKATLLCR